MIGLKRERNKTEVDPPLNQIGRVIPWFSLLNGEVARRYEELLHACKKFSWYRIPDQFFIGCNKFRFPSHTSIKRIREGLFTLGQKNNNTWYRWSFLIKVRNFVSCGAYKCRCGSFHKNKDCFFLHYAVSVWIMGSWGIRIKTKKQNKKQTIFGVAHRICRTQAT